MVDQRIAQPAFVRIVLRRILLKLAFAQCGCRDLAILVQREVARQRVPGFVGPGKTDLQKERIVALPVADPLQSRVADKYIRVETLLEIPNHPLIFLPPLWIGEMAIVGALLAVVS